MFRILGTLALVALLSCPLMAADPANVEVFGGYQYFHVGAGDVPGVDSLNINGWNVAVSGYFNRFVGITADFGGVYGTPNVLGVPIHTKVHTFMFGPTLRLSNPTHIVPFVHALGGGLHASADVSGLASASDTNAAWAVGGGVDLELAKIMSVRLAQADFLQTRASGASQNNFRFSAGLVIRF
jgi:opacity protein-like surface antigen